MSTHASIYYLDREGGFVHVAHDVLTDNIHIEVGDNSGPASSVYISYEEAIDMAAKVLGFMNWPNAINQRDMAAREASK